MNKKMLLLAAMAIGTQSILPLTASVDAMYNDIKQVIVEDALTGKTDQEKYDNVQEVLENLYRRREDIKYRILEAHTNAGRFGSQTAMLAAVGATLFGSAIFFTDTDRVECIFLGSATLYTGLAMYFQDVIEIRSMKNKLAELAVVITKLEAMKTELASKLGIVEAQRV